MKAFIITIIMLFLIILESLLTTIIHGGVGIGMLFGIVDAFLVFYLIETIEIKKRG